MNGICNLYFRTKKNHLCVFLWIFLWKTTAFSMINFQKYCRILLPPMHFSDVIWPFGNSHSATDHIHIYNGVSNLWSKTVQTCSRAKFGSNKNRHLIEITAHRIVYTRIGSEVSTGNCSMSCSKIGMHLPLKTGCP